MDNSSSRPSPLSRPRMLALIGAAVALASVITVCFVLPAEFGLDPTGLGQVTGLANLTGPKADVKVDRYYDLPYRSDELDIPLDADNGNPGADELEYKVRMQPGATLVYSWTVTGGGGPGTFHFDFHGESVDPRHAGQPIVIEYQQASGSQSAGALLAPMEGIFGWYVQNQSHQRAVMHLSISGFYELIPPGQPGNEARILPKGGKAGDA